MSLPILVDGTTLTAIALPPCVTAPATVDVSGSAVNVFSEANAAVLLSDIEAASTSPPQAYSSVTPPGYAGGTGHFDNFAVSSGDTSNFFDVTDELYLTIAIGTCRFTLDSPALSPASVPDPIYANPGYYPGTWIVNDHGQATVYLKASP